MARLSVFTFIKNPPSNQWSSILMRFYIAPAVRLQGMALHIYGFGNGAGVRNPDKRTRRTASGGWPRPLANTRIGRESMRLIALTMAAVVFAAAPAHAAWKAYKYPQYGFGVDFPAEPK